MNLNEYLQVKDYDYIEYCDYLQKKYGIGLCDYMTKNWNKNKKISRTKEGLYAHHKYEDHAIMLSDPIFAKNNPYEWQQKQNIVYCDLLEHLFLHILICENPSRNKNQHENVGFGGVVNLIAPELNDVYSGWITSQEWRKKCHSMVIDDENVYLLLLKRFKEFYNYNPFIIKQLCSSFNAPLRIWSEKNNRKIYKKIKKL
ncbi:MAG: hypothetical protein E7607_02825 [Ruminococcaceae bacterium]|nr:hypothetical protein [Oscillospiraceae bacterium]